MLFSLLIYGWVTPLLVAASAITSPRLRPLVLWHGLGDSHSSPGMLEFMSDIRDIHPGIFIHSIYIDKDLDGDRNAGFYGNVNSQLELVAAQLASIPELEHGFDGIGLSQGGQFFRAYVERYNQPPVNNLITFGSQHMGISGVPPCGSYDFLCQAARKALISAVYTSWAQSNLVQAQYFRDPRRYNAYLDSNHFLASINNEVEESRNQTYARNLASLNKLVLAIFTEDQTVVPKESAWFGSEEIISSGMHYISSDQQPLDSGATVKTTIIPMREQPLYSEDWIGLRELDERGGVAFATCTGRHMEMTDCWEDIVKRYTGGVVV